MNKLAQRFEFQVQTARCDGRGSSGPVVRAVGSERQEVCVLGRVLSEKANVAAPAIAQLSDCRHEVASLPLATVVGTVNTSTDFQEESPGRGKSHHLRGPAVGPSDTWFGAADRLKDCVHRSG